MAIFASNLTGTSSGRLRLRIPVAQWIQIARERRELSAMSEQQLRDIGISSASAVREAARPFWDLPEGR